MTKYILIADDDKELCKTLSECIKLQLAKTNCDYEIVYAYTPIDIEYKLKDYDIVLCLLDLIFEEFGSIDPIGLASRFPDTYFVVMSAYLDMIKPDNLVFFLAKPLAFDNLATIMNMALSDNDNETPTTVQ